MLSLLLSCMLRRVILFDIDMTCGAARSILPGRASRDRNRGVRSFRDNVASPCKEGGRDREIKAATPSIQGVGNQDSVVWSTQVKR